MVSGEVDSGLWPLWDSSFALFRLIFSVEAVPFKGSGGDCDLLPSGQLTLLSRSSAPGSRAHV